MQGVTPRTPRSDHARFRPVRTGRFDELTTLRNRMDRLWSRMTVNDETAKPRSIKVEVKKQLAPAA